MLALLLTAALGMAQVGPGVYRPLYPLSPAETLVPVPAFMLDRTPVTNADYLAFVQAQPRWQRGRVSRLFADPQYLASWAGPLFLGRARPAAPVTGVSWFAARAYCAWRGARLPSEREWELAAAASEASPDGSRDVLWKARVLGWYQAPSSKELADVGQTAANFWGVYDLHGLVWEWVEDYSAALLVLDSRDGGDRSRFCGAGASRASDTTDYAAFMRLAFRSSLEAHYTTANLGFRCASDLPLRTS